jgi:hypothetical protein
MPQPSSVGFADQLLRDLLPLLLPQVQCDRALVARLHLPPDRRAVLDQPPVAQRIARARRLDLDHVGAEVAERLAGKGAGDQLAHLDDPQALQGLLGSHALEGSCFHGRLLNQSSRRRP